jgi:hypothetical protein
MNDTKKEKEIMNESLKAEFDKVIEGCTEILKKQNTRWKYFDWYMACWSIVMIIASLFAIFNVVMTKHDHEQNEYKKSSTHDSLLTPPTFGYNVFQ